MDYQVQFGKVEGFNQNMAGKRMSVPIPITWDRELSAKKGSKKEMWTSLIVNNHVPYLATLRNLRNIIKADLSPTTLA